MELQKFSVTTDKPKVIDSFGRCIYCGSVEPPLSREHVIPRGLGGGIIISGASCAKCADITKRFEQACLRTNFGHHRLKTGLKSYHKNETPNTSPIRVLDDDKILTKELPISEHPYILYLPRIRRPPRIINDRPPTPLDKHSKYMTYLNSSEIKINAIIDLKFDMHSFYRFLAKIAHGFAVSHFGIDRIRPLLKEIIIDDNLDLCSYYIGRNIDDEFGPKRGSICNLKTFQKEIRGVKYICTAIQLFANIDGIFNGRPMGTPIYFIVVGEFIA